MICKKHPQMTACPCQFERCTNSEDHLCEKCEGLPHGIPFVFTPEMRERMIEDGKIEKENFLKTSPHEKLYMATLDSRYNDQKAIELAFDCLESLWEEVQELRKKLSPDQ